MPDKAEILKAIGQDILTEIRKQATDVGATFEDSVEDVAAFISSKAQELSTAVGKPGFDEALMAARDSVLLKAAGRASTISCARRPAARLRSSPDFWSCCNKENGRDVDRRARSFCRPRLGHRPGRGFFSRRFFFWCRCFSLYGSCSSNAGSDRIRSR
jgi:hypothetical protein